MCDQRKGLAVPEGSKRKGRTAGARGGGGRRQGQGASVGLAPQLDADADAEEEGIAGPGQDACMYRWILVDVDEVPRPRRRGGTRVGCCSR